MSNFYTRVFCRECRLHFEYGLTGAELAADFMIRCPWCDRPARHAPFQPCDAARFELIGAQYERLVRQAELEQASRRSRGWHVEEEDEDYPFERKRRKRSR